MKKKTILLTLIISVIVVFTGCTSSNNQGDSNAPAIDTPGNKELTDLEKVRQYITTIGGSDLNVVNLLGDGIETVDEKNQSVILRRYEMNLFGKSVPLVMNIEGGNITDMVIIPKSGSYTEWFDEITDTLGKPDEILDVYRDFNQEVKASAWTLDDGSLTLQSTCGTVLLRMNGN